METSKTTGEPLKVMQGNLFSQSEMLTHRKENNQESQEHLNKNRPKFSGKCRELLIRLCNGERLQFAECVYNIGDLRRRSLDCIEAGIPVQRKFLHTDGQKKDVKTYYLNEEDIGWVREKYL